MSVTEGTSERFSNDPALDQSINDVLSEFVEQPDPAAAAPSSQDGRGLVESSETPAAPSPGDSSQAPPPAANAADGTQPPAPEPEPQYEPFGYTVSGEQRSIDGFFRIPGEGVFVPEAQVPRLQQLASRADANEVQLRALHEQNQDWERLTTWTIPGPNGQQQTLTGRAAYERLRAEREVYAASDTTVRSYLSDPAKLASLLVVYNEQGQAIPLEGVQVSINPNAKRILDLEIKDAARDAIGRAQQHFAQVGGRISPHAAPTEQVTPEQIIAQVSQQAPQVLTAKLEQWGLKGALTAEDVQALAAQLPRYVRLATKDDVAADPGLRLGAPVLENDFETLVRRVAAVSQRGATSAQARTVADRFNQGQQRGRASNQPARPASPIPPQQPANDPRSKKQRERAQRTNWDDLLSHGMADPDVQAALNGA